MTYFMFFFMGVMVGFLISVSIFGIDFRNKLENDLGDQDDRLA